MTASTSVLVRAEIHGLAGAALELRGVLVEHAARTGRADGALACTASEPLGADEGEFVLDTWWRDERGLRAHYASVEYARYADQVGPLLARPSDVQIHYVERSVRATADPSSDPGRQG